jgi:hypothetical protein
MLGVLAKYFEDVSVLRRLLFAVVFLSPELPLFWGVVVEFATAGKVSKLSVTPDQVKAIVENIHALNSAAFTSDLSLEREIIFLSIPGRKPLGHILISNLKICEKCGSHLLIRKDRHSSVTIYDARLGTIPGAHLHKICQNLNCRLTQYYGYYTSGGNVVFNAGWESLQYFPSSRDTFFSLDIVQEVDANVLIGQLSFKQQAEIYNYNHNCVSSASARSEKYVYTTLHSRTCFCSTLESRQQMDRRRLEEAFLQYAVLRMASWYQDVEANTLSFHDGLPDVLSSLMPTFLNKFMENYSGVLLIWSQHWACSSMTIIDACFFFKAIIVQHLDAEKF